MDKIDVYVMLKACIKNIINFERDNFAATTIFHDHGPPLDLIRTIQILDPYGECATRASLEWSTGPVQPNFYYPAELNAMLPVRNIFSIYLCLDIFFIGSPFSSLTHLSSRYYEHSVTGGERRKIE